MKVLNMMNNVEILLTINLEASLSSRREEVTIDVTEEREVNGKKLTKRYQKSHLVRLPGVASRKTTISEETVEFLSSPHSQIPEWYRAKWNGNKSWDMLTKDEKLQQHFARMAHPHSFSYVYVG